MDTKTSQRTTFKVWTPLAKSLEKKMDQAFLRRDAYFNNLIKIELHYLENETQQRSNSREVKDYLQNMLKTLDLTMVSMTLDVSVIQKLNSLCATSNIIRDAFINRLILYTVADSNLIDLIFFEDSDWRNRILKKESFHLIDPFDVFSPMRIQQNPFENIRLALQIEGAVDQSFYTRIFNGSFPSKNINLTGLNCLFDDEYLPKTQSEVAVLLQDLI